MAKRWLNSADVIIDDGTGALLTGLAADDPGLSRLADRLIAALIGGAGLNSLTLGTNGAGGAPGTLVLLDGADPGASATLTYALAKLLADLTITAANLNLLDDGAATALHGHLPYVTAAGGVNKAGAVALVAEKCNVITGANGHAVLPVITAGTVGTTVRVVFGGTVSVVIDTPTGAKIADGAANGTLTNSTAGDAGWANVTLQAVSTTAWIIAGFDGTWTTA